MTDIDRKVLLAKVDTLYYASNDPLIQSVVTLVRDVVNSIETTTDKEMGFTSKRSDVRTEEKV